MTENTSYDVYLWQNEYGDFEDEAIEKFDGGGDEDTPTCSCDGHAGAVCGIHEEGPAPPIGGYGGGDE